MNAKLKEVFDSYLKSDAQQLADVGRRAFANIVGKYHDVTKDEDTAFAFGMACLSSFVVQDNEMDSKEWALLEYIFQQDMSREQAMTMFRSSFDSDYYQQIKDIVEHDSFMKENICRLGLAVCAIDGRITDDEAAWLEFLIQ